MCLRSDRAPADPHSPGLKPASQITAHSLRHYAASRILERSENLAATQDILGHASTDTTRVVAELGVQHLRRAHRKAFGE